MSLALLYNNNQNIIFDKIFYKHITILLPLYKENIGSYLSAILGQYGIRNQLFISIVLKQLLNLIEKVVDDFTFFTFTETDIDDDVNDGVIMESEGTNLETHNYNKNINLSISGLSTNSEMFEFDDKNPLSELDLIIPCYLLLKPNNEFSLFIKQPFTGSLFKFLIKQQIKKKRIPFYLYHQYWCYLVKYYPYFFNKQIVYYTTMYHRRYYLNFLGLYKILLFSQPFYCVDEKKKQQKFYKKLRLTFYNKWF